MDIDNNINEVIKYINLELEKGRTFKAIEEELGFNDRVLYKKLIRRGVKRSKEGYKLFTLSEDIKPHIDDVRSVYEGVVNYDNSNNSKSNQLTNNDDVISNQLTNEELTKIRLLLSSYDDIQQMLYNNSDTNNSNTLVVKNFDDITLKSIKVSNEVYQEFKEFCNQHKEYTQQNILSSCIEEYINKYK